MSRADFVSYVVSVCAADAEGETLRAVVDGLTARFGTRVGKLASGAPDRVQRAKAVDDAACWIAYYRRGGGGGAAGGGVWVVFVFFGADLLLY
jgi:hypothetical protein